MFNMTNDKGSKIYRKFLYFYENKIEVHFKDLNEIFYNGLILDLNKDKDFLILSERKRGTIPILLEFINDNSIEKFKEVGK